MSRIAMKIDHQARLRIFCQQFIRQTISKVGGTVCIGSGYQSRFMLGVQGAGEDMPGIQLLTVGCFNCERGNLVFCVILENKNRRDKVVWEK
jgi:hypothetical protein